MRLYSSSEAFLNQTWRADQPGRDEMTLEAQVAYQRAFEAVLWAMPASAIYRLEAGFLELPGMADNVIVAFSAPARAIQEYITPNQVTPYIVAVSDLRKGPVVLEVPAKTDKAVLYGQVVDAWQITIADVGPTGADKGAGGKYLFSRRAIKNRFLTGTSRSSPPVIASCLRSARFNWEVRRKPTPMPTVKR